MMGTLEIIQPGVQSSIQDTGRIGFRHIGVPNSGAFDQLSFRTGNRLLGNAATDAAIEMTMSGGTFKFHNTAVVCLTGATSDNALLVDGDRKEQIRFHQPIEIPSGNTLKIGRFTNGFRGYLCIGGGIQYPRQLGSRSALVSLPESGLGGTLKLGDLVHFGKNMITNGGSTKRYNLKDGTSAPDESHVLRIVSGAHFKLFNKSQHDALEDICFHVSDQSNRAGVRLVGGFVPGELPSSVSSEGALPGFIQIPPSGEPIILGVDGPTTGGYPVIACVIEADLQRLAQFGLREQVKFRWVTRKRAQEIMQEQLDTIQSLQPTRPAQASWIAEELYKPTVLLSCDTGEAPPGPDRDQEMALLPYVTAVSIACGGHAGDEDSMRQAITAASRNGCFIGAHPAYPDPENFGRKEMAIDQESLGQSLRNQLTTFSRLADECDSKVSYIKAHGSLYHKVAHDVSFARWYWDICESIIPHAIFVCPIGSASLESFKLSEIPVLAEGFCDRVYESDGTLRARSASDACITDPITAVSQAERLINESKCQLLCVHSDTQNAVHLAQLVHNRLTSLGHKST